MPHFTLVFAGHNKGKSGGGGNKHKFKKRKEHLKKKISMPNFNLSYFSSIYRGKNNGKRKFISLITLEYDSFATKTVTTTVVFCHDSSNRTREKFASPSACFSYSSSSPSFFSSFSIVFTNLSFFVLLKTRKSFFKSFHFKNMQIF